MTVLPTNYLFTKVVNDYKNVMKKLPHISWSKIPACMVLCFSGQTLHTTKRCNSSWRKPNTLICFFTRLTQIWLGLNSMYATSSVGQKSTTFGSTTTLSTDMIENCLYTCIRTFGDRDDEEASALWFDGCCLRCDCSDECFLKGNCCPGKKGRHNSINRICAQTFIDFMPDGSNKQWVFPEWKLLSERANSIECYIHIWLKMFYEYGPRKDTSRTFRDWDENVHAFFDFVPDMFNV